MNNSSGNCPTPEKIFKYFYMELDKDEEAEFEAHFSECSQCISEYDYYKDFIEQITPSARVQKEIWKNANADTFSVAAAASNNTSGTSEIISTDRKYLLKKISYLDNTGTSLLVIKLMDSITSGRILVYYLEDTSSNLIGSELIDEDNKICFEVDSDIQLTKLLVTFTSA
ncbi:hypothetical protein LY28_01653 [Ruminiclostridium sufflavum DSM 19573]|uniref:Uncharacterized protein n=1 Tax=Ruminiclostridium sufflavum DSM 19573 TaxID=1121337 RepID=A0A318XMU7_9FIRM|nr:zf-HC2 domain-containing protein [Ruminiclostridium sufflavum]PYG87943.1 hypothetical protein LY28_01653 [Ruminiclostridium sufflavum DSM 19573]